MRLCHIFWNVLCELLSVRNLRSRDALLLVEPKNKLKRYGRRAFSRCGPKVWNSLPFHVRKCKNVNDFGRKLKTSFLVKYIKYIKLYFRSNFLALFTYRSLFMNVRNALGYFSYNAQYKCMYVCVAAILWF